MEIEDLEKSLDESERGRYGADDYLELLRLRDEVEYVSSLRRVAQDSRMANLDSQFMRATRPDDLRLVELTGVSIGKGTWWARVPASGSGLASLLDFLESD